MRVIHKVRCVVLGVLVGAILSIPVTYTEQNAFTPTPADQAELKHILHEVNRAKGQGYTQTEAQLSVPSVQQAMSGELNFARNKGIITEALHKEHALKDGYYVFYTAIPYMRLFQDVTRKLYKRKIGNVGALKDKSFQFIRYSYNDPVYGQYKNATDFLVKELTQNGIIDDNQVRLKTILVSTNLSLFGNAAFAGESTWRFLNKPQPWGVAPAAWLEASLKSFGYPAEYAKKLIALVPLIKHDQGDLFQIFVPKAVVDEVGYLSWRQGIPFDPGIIEKWFGRDPLRLGKLGEVKDAIIHDEINERVYNLRRQWKTGNPEFKGLVNLMIQHAQEGKYWLSTGLDAYKNSPEQVFEINHQQARLLITNDMLLNPDSGIKIYRYSNLPASQISEYKKKLKNVMLEMEAHKKRIAPK